MPSHAALSVCAVAQLGEFKILALSRLAAQHEEIGRLRAGHTVLPSLHAPAAPGS